MEPLLTQLNATLVSTAGWTLAEAYEKAVEIYVFPTHPAHVAVTCASFFVMMLAMCASFEATNPKRNEPGRRQQIASEILESLPAVIASTSVSVLHLNYAYPARWGHLPPVFPSSVGSFLVECMYWLACFEVSVYFLHRLLHVRSPVDIYRRIHLAHHLFFKPTAFAAQAIHPLEAIMFAETSLLASVFLVPISVATQYLCGIALLVWSIAAHDHRAFLDRGAHYEHHSHPQTNFGFLGLADVVMGTVWWGHRHDDATRAPDYVARLGRVHMALFGVAPVVDVVGGKKSE